MSFRNLALRWAQLARPNGLQNCRFMGVSARVPGVYDHLVEVTVLDKDGLRHSVRGLEGQTLAQLLLEHPELSQGLLAPAPSGKGSMDAHVIVAKEYLEKMAAPTEIEETDLMELAEGHIVKNSRLASAVKLSPEMEGLTVALGEIGFWQTL